MMMTQDDDVAHHQPPSPQPPSPQPPSPQHLLDTRSRVSSYDSSSRLEELAGRPHETLPILTNRLPWHRKISRRIIDFRAQCGAAVNSNRAQAFVVFLIALNAAQIGIGTFDFVTENPSVDSAFEKVDFAFLTIFTVELGLQFFYRGLTLFLDGWLVFDFIIIVVSWSFSGLTIIRAFRIFRALRLVTRIKVMKNLVGAVFAVIPRILAILLLMFLLFYIFGVMMTQLFKNLYADGGTYYDYFSRLDTTFFTLFQLTTTDDSISLARQVMKTYSWGWVPIVTFITISGFVMVNLLIAVIFDAVSSMDDEDKAKVYGDYDEDSDLSEETRPPGLREKIENFEDQVEELLQAQEYAQRKARFLADHFRAKSREAKHKVA